MRRIAIGLALIVAAAGANAAHYDITATGGRIVTLTDEKGKECNKDNDGTRTAYALDESGVVAGLGCWFVREGRVFVAWHNGSLKGAVNTYTLGDSGASDSDQYLRDLLAAKADAERTQRADAR